MDITEKESLIQKYNKLNKLKHSTYIETGSLKAINKYYLLAFLGLGMALYFFNIHLREVDNPANLFVFMVFIFIPNNALLYPIVYKLRQTHENKNNYKWTNISRHFMSVCAMLVILFPVSWGFILISHKTTAFILGLFLEPVGADKFDFFFVHNTFSAITAIMGLCIWIYLISKVKKDDKNYNNLKENDISKEITTLKNKIESTLTDIDEVQYLLYSQKEQISDDSKKILNTILKKLLKEKNFKSIEDYNHQKLKLKINKKSNKVKLKQI